MIKNDFYKIEDKGKRYHSICTSPVMERKFAKKGLSFDSDLRLDKKKSSNKPETKVASSSIIKTKLTKKLTRQKTSTLNDNRLTKIHTIKQIYDSEINFEFDQIIKQGEHNTTFYFNKKKIKIYSKILFFLLLLSIILSLIQNQISIDHIIEHIKSNNITDIKTFNSITPSISENVLNSFNMIISISSAIFVFLIFHTKVEQYKNDFHLDKNDNIFSSGLWKQCFLKSFISLLCYPPGVGGIIHFSYKSVDCRILTWNSIITIISLSKTILVINLIRLVSSYSDETSKSICRNYNVRHGVLFSAKSLMHKHSIIIICVICIYTLIIFGIIVRDFEFASYEKGELISNARTVLNSIWLIFSVMSTLSIGDYYPVTPFGNFFCIIAGIIGYYILTILFFALSDYSEFSFNEKKSYVKLRKIMSGENLENKAASVIKGMMILRKNLLVYIRAKRMGQSNLNFSFDNSSGGGNVIDSLKEIFAISCVLKINIKAFKNEYTMAKNCGVPVDELIMNTSNKYLQTMDICIKLMRKIKNVNDDLESIDESQEGIEKTLDSIEKMQKNLEKYLVKLNNRKLLYKIRERNNVDVKLTKKYSFQSKTNTLMDVTSSTKVNQQKGLLQTTVMKGGINKTEVDNHSHIFEEDNKDKSDCS